MLFIYFMVCHFFCFQSACVNQEVFHFLLQEKSFLFLFLSFRVVSSPSIVAQKKSLHQKKSSPIILRSIPTSTMKIENVVLKAYDREMDSLPLLFDGRKILAMD